MLRKLSKFKQIKLFNDRIDTARRHSQSNDRPTFPIKEYR